MDADKMEGRVLGLLGAQNVSPTGKGDFFRKTSLTCWEEIRECPAEKWKKKKRVRSVVKEEN